MYKANVFKYDVNWRKDTHRNINMNYMSDIHRLLTYVKIVLSKTE